MIPSNAFWLTLVHRLINFELLKTSIAVRILYGLIVDRSSEFAAFVEY